MAANRRRSDASGAGGITPANAAIQNSQEAAKATRQLVKSTDDANALTAESNRLWGLILDELRMIREAVERPGAIR